MNTLKFGNGEWYGKEGTILAYNDENNNYKPLPFTFDRDSVATRVNKQGLIETVGADQPRIDYLNDSNGALLLEPSRTNLVTQSELFSNWQTEATNIIASDVISPSGQNNAKKIITNNVTNQSYANTTATVTQSATYTFSCFAKKGEVRFICLVGLNPLTFSYFDLELGVKGTSTVTSKMEDYGNGWYRCSATFTADTTSKFCGIYLTPTDNSLTASSIPNGYGNYIFGAQLEQGSYSTSYIPTQGSAVTRLADVCVDAGNEQVINSTEGVLYAEIAALANDGTTREMALSDGGASNRIEVRYLSSANDIQAVIRGAASTILLSYTLSDAKEFAKVAVKYKSGDYALWIDGVERAVSTTTGTPTGLSQFAFDDGNGGFNIYSKVKDVKIYNTALTDQELIALTQV